MVANEKSDSHLDANEAPVSPSGRRRKNVLEWDNMRVQLTGPPADCLPEYAVTAGCTRLLNMPVFGIVMPVFGIVAVLETCFWRRRRPVHHSERRLWASDWWPVRGNYGPEWYASAHSSRSLELPSSVSLSRPLNSSGCAWRCAGMCLLDT